MKRIACPVIVGIALAVGFGANANAFELFGKCYGTSCKNADETDPGIIDPKNYTIDFEFLNTDEDATTHSVKTNSGLWQGRDNPVGGSAGLIAKAKGDYRRILAGLYNEGYYGGSISITIDGKEAASLKPGAELPDNSYIVIQVDRGDLYRFGDFKIQNRAPSSADVNDQVEASESLKNQTGDVAKAGQVKLASKLAIEEWRQQGHPKAQISSKHVKALHLRNLLNVELQVEPGPLATYGDVTVKGAENMNAEFIAYMTGLRKGKQFDPDDIQKAKKRLDKLDVFNVRKIQESDSVKENGEMPIAIVVDEKKQRRFGAGATLSSTDGAGFEAYWMHRNLFGKAERLRIEGAIGGLGETFDGDELDYSASVSFTKPGVFSPDTDWYTTIFARREFNDTFEGETAGGSSVLKHLLNDRTTLSGGIFVEYSEFDDAFAKRDFLSAGLTGSVIVDGRDNKLDPSEGFYTEIAAKPFHEFEYNNTGARLDAELRSYTSLDRDADTVLATRIKLGSVLGINRSETPTNFLYFAGGGGSVRGFGFKNIGVVESNGDISGGRSLFESSLELRQRINETIGVVGFVDSGTVSRDSFIDFSEDLRVSAGLGLRYYTGIGPIRLDVAAPLNPRNGDPDFGMFAGIGQAF